MVIINVKTAHLDMGPTGFIVYARDFLRCYTVYSPEQPFSPAKYYLICRSIELSLKSYLVLNGIGYETCKKKFRHNISKILTECIDLGIEKYVTLSEANRLEIEKANDWYDRKGFEYFSIRNIVEPRESLPNLRTLEGIAEQLVSVLEPICISTAQKP